MRSTSDFRTASKENHKAFCALHPEIKISYKEFSNVIYHINRQYMSYILETGTDIKLPYGFGNLTINRKKTKTTFTTKKGETKIILPVDWQASKRTGKKVYFYNDHTEGWRYKWTWYKNTSVNLKFQDIWAFKPSREWSRQLAHNLKQEDNSKYLYLYGEYINHKK